MNSELTYEYDEINDKVLVFVVAWCNRVFDTPMNVAEVLEPRSKNPILKIEKGLGFNAIEKIIYYIDVMYGE